MCYDLIYGTSQSSIYIIKPMSPVLPDKRLRGRPKSEAKKGQIYGAAIKLFVMNGFEQTTMADIASSAGVSKQTVYSHFANKDELYDAAIRHACSKIGMGSEFPNDRRSPGRVLEEVGGRFLHLLLTPSSRALYRLVLANSVAQPGVAQLFFEVGPHNFIRHLAAYLDAQHQRDRLRVRDSWMAAAQFFSMLRGELHMRAILEIGPPPTKKQIDTYVRACVVMFIDAHRVEP